ncbi:FkbM family methyltransferase [Roseomonas sp. CCTCC AB2023176]|uniref:FkbM family methyltransferase n=1 Tax=Roseomonas sp. CCTCC AB2023176 TaxID=3342640 RepID=UPI0035E074EB
MREPAPAQLLLENAHLRLRACRYGPMLYNARDRYVGGCLDTYGEFSEAEVDLFAQVLRPGMTALDVGANIGAHTLPMAQFVGPKGVVVAYEPQRIIFQTLCANLALGGMENVVAHWAAATARPGTVRVPRPDYSVPGNFGGVALHGDAAATEEVAGLPVDSLDLVACHFIKVDVEGMEAEVLDGAAATIARHRPLLYLENDRAPGSQALLGRLLGWGYRCWWHLPPLVRAPNHAGEGANIFPGIVSVNVFAAPAESGASLGSPHEITSADARPPSLARWDA